MGERAESVPEEDATGGEFETPTAMAGLLAPLTLEEAVAYPGPNIFSGTTSKDRVLPTFAKVTNQSSE